MRILMAAAVILFGAPALAQPAPSFPPDSAWAPFSCGSGPMVDARRDQTAAIADRDVVGDSRAPAGYHATDAQYLYLRLRVDDAPTMGANLHPFAWGFAFSVDSVSTGYEVLIALDGAAGVVTLSRHQSTSLLDSPAEPADQPPVASYPMATHARTGAADTTFGNDRDYFVEMAVPWTALTPLGFYPDMPVVVWAGTSSAADRLDGDLACHDAGKTASVPSLSKSASAPTTAAVMPGGGTGGSGGGSGGAGGLDLEGGPGCQVAGRTGGRGLAVLLLLAALRPRRWRR
jgi:hypothetical protein